MKIDSKLKFSQWLRTKENKENFKKKNRIFFYSSFKISQHVFDATV